MRLAPAALVCALAACGGPRLHYDLRLPEEQALLPNSTRVVVLPDRSADLIAVVIRYDVGSREDPDGALGLAHLAEHVTFLQPAPGGGTIGEALDARTLATNAFTSEDNTSYYNVSTPDRLGDILALEAARLAGRCEAVSPADFARQRLVVRQELRQRIGDRLTFAAALASLFPPGHPNARRPLDEDTGVGAATLDRVCAFIAARYTPAAATVAIVGNVEPRRAIELASKAFAPVPARPQLPRAPVPPPARRDPILTFTDPRPGAAVLVAWPVPEDASQEAVGFIAAALGIDNPVLRKALASTWAMRCRSSEPAPRACWWFR